MDESYSSTFPAIMQEESRCGFEKICKKNVKAWRFKMKEEEKYFYIQEVACVLFI